MARSRIRCRPTATALLVAAAASCGLTACGSSVPAGQAGSVSLQAPAKRNTAAIEIFNCARHHGVNLPPPTEAGVNVSGVKGRRNEVIVSNCYHKALKRAARAERAAKAQQAGQEAPPPALGEEEPPTG